MKNMQKFLSTYSFILVFLLVYMIPTLVFGADQNPFEKAGVSAANADALYTDLKKVITIIQIIGGFWVLGCLIFAGIKLSGSGNNPQARTQGFFGVGFALIGAWIIMKATTIAGWVISLGTF